VAYVLPSRHLGGSERQASAVIPRLPALQIDVLPVVGPTPLLCRWLEQKGVRGTILSRAFPDARYELTVPRLMVWRGYLTSLRRAAGELTDLVRDGGIDLVLAASPFAWLAATRVARRLGVPVVWRADRTRLGSRPALTLALCAAAAHPDLILYDGEVARAAFGCRSVPGAVVPPGVDLDLFRSSRSEGRMRPAGAATVVGFAGRLGPYGRVEDFLRMAARVARRRTDVAFLVAGDGPQRAECEALARRAGLDRCLRFLGFVAHMPSFYASCDIVVHPSDVDACSNVVLEAMALERAVVAADVPATAEILTPGREGLVCPPRVPEAFAELVVSLIDMPSLRTSLGRAAAARVRRCFDASTATARLARALRQAGARARLDALPTTPLALPA
jgi:glycosyltransferase involved in cell wall biosynthesis